MFFGGNFFPFSTIIFLFSNFIDPKSSKFKQYLIKNISPSPVLKGGKNLDFYAKKGKKGKKGDFLGTLSF